MKGMRRVDGWIERDEKGWPRVVVDERQLAQAAYELMVEKFADKPKRPSRWKRIKAWVKSRLNQSQRT